MKRFVSRLIVAIPMWTLLGSSAAAMCIWFVPPSRQFAPATNMKTLIVQNEGQVRMVVQPEFSGDATDFALVMPFPSLPEVAEAPESIFEDLEDLTNPLLEFNDGIGFATLESDASTRSNQVRVIEERDVGDFKTVTLEASSEEGLSDWLVENGYELTDEKRQIVSQYVADGGYFVALKVNIDKADIDSSGILQGKLLPIEFSFSSDSVMLPLRLMSGDNSLVTLTVYTVSDQLTYIPGAEIQYSRKVTSTDLKNYSSLEGFDPWRKWLVRNVFQVDTNEVEADLPLQTTTDTFIVVPEEQPIILNPDQLASETGVIVSENGEIKYSEEDSIDNPATVAEKASPVTWTMVIALSISNVVLLIMLISRTEASRRK